MGAPSGTCACDISAPLQHLQPPHPLLTTELKVGCCCNAFPICPPEHIDGVAMLDSGRLHGRIVCEDGIICEANRLSTAPPAA
mmetsp:Transcript_33833/g.55866  ORF Transcript_33833/g.55866 Transcript_33833/m.55866 type:complete len:83 (-) Transcript_33833:867-1115(-)